MAPRTIYGNLPDGLSPLSLWDQSLADMGSLGIIPCTAVGTNAITLTPIASVNAPNVTTLQPLQSFSFAAAANSTGPVTVPQIGNLTVNLKVYRPDGVTQANSGDISSGVVYVTQYNPALNSNAGGLVLSAPSSGVQSVVNDTNVTGSIAGPQLTLGWTGTLAAGRLNSNVVQAVTNDTNITGSISAQNLTFSWAGTLAAARLNSNVVQAITNDTNVTGSITAQNLTLGWTGNLAIGRGGTGAATQSAAASNIFPTPTRAGDITYWNGSSWATLAGNNSGTQVLQENSSGVPSWVTVTGTGTVTSVVGNGVTITTSGTVPPPYGLVNHSLAVSASAGALTIALKDNAGSDPSAASPVNGYFRNVTGTTGSWTQLTVNAALSLTLPSSSTLGIASSTACRIWVVLFNDAGTARLGAINCTSVGTNSTQIFSIAEGIPTSSTAVSAAATSAGVFYTGVAVSAKSFLIVGYAEWNATGMTAGTWTTTNLNFIQSFGPGIRKPGDTVQHGYFPKADSGTSATTMTWTSVSWPTTPTITPSSAANVIRVTYNMYANASGGNALFARIFRGGATAIGVGNAAGSRTQVGGALSRTSDTDSLQNIGQTIYDAPNTTSATTYAPQFFLQAGTAEFNQVDNDAGNTNTIPRALSHVSLEEIMG